MMIGTCDFSAHLAAQAEAVFTRQHDVEDQKIDAMGWPSPASSHARPLAVVTLQALARRYFAISSPRFAIIFDPKGCWAMLWP